MNSLNEESGSKFGARKGNIVNDQSNVNYDTGNEIINNTEVLKSNLCDLYGPYILVKSAITITGDNGARIAF